jgi:hypothetical protein
MMGRIGREAPPIGGGPAHLRRAATGAGPALGAEGVRPTP